MNSDAQQEALAAVETARASLSLALAALREARGEPPDEACHACNGSGNDAIAGLFGKEAECDVCKGTRKTPKRYPIVVTEIKMDAGEPLRQSLMRRGTTWVRVRPVAKKYGDRTYLGWLLGDMAQSVSVRLERDGTMKVGLSSYNPAIFVPDIGTVIFGHSSWWSPIRSAQDLSEITDVDIEDVWYVKALKDVLRSDDTHAEASAADNIGGGS